MSKRNQVQFSRPEDPKFLRLIKEQIGYKNEPSVDTKRQKLNQEFDDSSDSDDEQPQIVVTKSGDLTAEQVEAEKRRIESENLTKPADLSQRIIFKGKSSKADKDPVVEKDPTEEPSKKKEKQKKSVTASKLSFALEDENYESAFDDVPKKEPQSLAANTFPETPPFVYDFVAVVNLLLHLHCNTPQ